MDKAIKKLIEAANADYERSYPRLAEREREMVDRFNARWEVKVGKKYIKLIHDDSAWAFVVHIDDDDKFRRGDILKPAGWATPARNAARGNVLDGGYQVEWTGPMYLA
tara:strand:+ start:78 stop:401 length:324 start_codon:yes stop_codon:yes gene_type:complete